MHMIAMKHAGHRATRWSATIALLTSGMASHAQLAGDLVDMSRHFERLDQVYFVGSSVVEFDPTSGSGRLRWDRYERHPNLSFNKLDAALGRAQSSEFPGTEYDRDPALPFDVQFISPQTIRLRFSSRDVAIDAVHREPSIMLAGPLPSDDTWDSRRTDGAVSYESAFGRVEIGLDPWYIAVFDADDRLLTRSQTLGEPPSFTPYVPFSFVRRGEDLGRSTAAVFSLSHDERIFGLGESFTRLDKRGQKIHTFLRDGMGAQSQVQYKSVPFFLSSAGYGMFVHTSAPVTFDFGHDFDAHTSIYSGDELMDLFIFIGEPKDVVSEYTAITGRSPVPPLWSFGLWMSRITYKSEAEVRDVAAELRKRRIPTDVIHLDTGWFETDWRGDYAFSDSRFDDPAAMIRDLREDGFRISLWQLTYYTPKNSLWKEIVDNGFHVRNAGGTLPALDAVLDFSNPDAVTWYQDKLRGLLELGVGAIKADFGENAPLDGIYHSGRTGWYEHNLYPVRYNDAVFEITREVTGDGILWGRSAWAGSQRYPLHWGGDAENTDSAMAATLRAGLSMGLSGFSFWSHDIGGFVDRAPRDLYRRWTPFGALTSHTRTHGAPPREPWEYDEELVNDFRRAMELKYRLMPYIYTQARRASSHGHPMMRALFFDYPDDPTSWMIEDEYLFGPDLLVAPLFRESGARRVYLPPGRWIDYQTGRAYAGAQFHEIEAGDIPIVLLARAGSVIPHTAVAQHTGAIDWENIVLRVFEDGSDPAVGYLSLPGRDIVSLAVQDGSLRDDPYPAEVSWQIETVSGGTQ